MRIIKNAIRCLKCGDVIESTSVHDFKFCSCQACAVDGGHEYLRRCGEPANWEDISEVSMDEPKDAPFNWNDETEYGEPQAWYHLADGTSLEVCHEENGIAKARQYYSLRRHCTEQDFDDDVYADTCGVIEQYSGDSQEIFNILQKLTARYGLE